MVQRVVQEAGLARQCTAFWGDQQIEYYEIIELADWFAYSVHAPRSSRGNVIGRVVADIFIDIQCTYANTTTWRTKSPIVNSFVELYPKEKQFYVDLLFSARSLQVTDQRDIVYSSLGSPLALDPDGKLMVEPDYTEPLLALQIRAAHALLRSPRDAPHVLLRVIHSAEEELATESEGHHAVPTWVPRWIMASDTEARPIPLTYSFEYRQAPYRASRGSPAFCSETGKDKTLTVTGLIFDTITWTSLLLEAKNLGSDVQEWEPRFREAKMSAIETVWRDLLAQAQGKPIEHLATETSFTFSRGRPRSPDYVDNFLAYCENLRSLIGSESKSPFPPPRLDKGVALDGEWAMMRCRDRRLAFTAKQRLALVPLIAQVGDTCCIIQGMDVPVVLRPTSQGSYKFVGEAYVNEVMDGELMGQLVGKSPEWVVIRVQ